MISNSKRIINSSICNSSNFINFNPLRSNIIRRNGSLIKKDKPLFNSKYNLPLLNTSFIRLYGKVLILLVYSLRINSFL